MTEEREPTDYSTVNKRRNIVGIELPERVPGASRSDSPLPDEQSVDQESLQRNPHIMMSKGLKIQ